MSNKSTNHLVSSTCIYMPILFQTHSRICVWKNKIKITSSPVSPCIFLKFYKFLNYSLVSY